MKKLFCLSPENKWLWIAIALLFQLFNVWMYYFFSSEENKTIYQFTGDAYDYIQPVENLVTEQVYYFLKDNYAGRMPGLAVILYPFRLLLGNMHSALTGLVFFQVLMSGISVYLFSIMVYDKNKNQPKFFYTAFLLLLLSNYLWFYNSFVLTESLALSSIIFSFYNLHRYTIHQKNYSLLYSGLFLTWAIFLRAYVGVLFVPMALIIWHTYRYSINKKLIFSIAIFVSSFLVLDGVWIIRNYGHYNKIIPLQSTPYKGLDEAEFKHAIALGKLGRTVGEDVIRWNPKAKFSQWFQSEEYLNEFGFKRPGDEVINEKLFFDNYNIDTLKKIREYWICAETERTKKTISEDSANICKNEIIRLTEIFIAGYKENNPLNYYVISKIKLLKLFVTQPFTYYLPFVYSNVGVFFKAVKLFYLVFNNLIVYLGILFGMYFLLTIFKRFDVISALYAFLLLFILFYWALLRGIIEYRYFIFVFLSCVWFCSIYTPLIFEKIYNLLYRQK